MDNIPTASSSSNCDGEFVTETNDEPARKVSKVAKLFDFTKYKKRHILLKFSYLGWDYDGYVVQENTENTIEDALFAALMKTKLIAARESSNYHRCGRTDKGVSAFQQVISIDVRSSVSEGVGVFESDRFNAEESKSICETEMNYAAILNRALPPEIRAFAWAPTERNFSARFDCDRREYKYFFPKGHLNIEKMQLAAKHLLGEHDFRNLCRMDVGGGVKSFVRSIDFVTVEPMCQTAPDSSYNIYVMSIRGKAFLWHQIRCIMGILILIGEGKEEPELIRQLLDVNNCTRKPQYAMAADFPLCLYECSYENVAWSYDFGAVVTVMKHFQTIWTQFSVKASMIKAMVEGLEKICSPIQFQTFDLIPGNKPKTYKRVLERPVSDTLEEKLDKLNKKKRLKTGFDEIEDD